MSQPRLTNSSSHRPAIPTSPGASERIEISELPSSSAPPVPPPFGDVRKHQQQRVLAAAAVDGGIQHHLSWISSPIRWAVLFQYSLLSFLNGVQWICLAVCVHQATERFRITTYQVDITVACFYFMFVLTACAGVAFFDRYGIKKSLIVANACNVMGFAVKLLVSLLELEGDTAFAVLLLSQCVSGFAQAFFLPVPSALSCLWFPDTERTVATAIAAGSNPLGGAAGFLITGAFVSKERHGWADFNLFFAVMFAVNVLDSLLLFCVVPESPAIAPSVW